ncbi:flagellar protein FliT, partial [Hydrogenophaga sp.]
LIAQLRHRSRHHTLSPDDRREKTRIMQRILRADAQIRCLAEPWLGDLEVFFEKQSVPLH